MKTNTHPLVEFSLMRQEGRHLLHVINLSGHSQTGYFDPIPMDGIRVEVTGTFRGARSVSAGTDLPVTQTAAAIAFELPPLEQYQLIELR